MGSPSIVVRVLGDVTGLAKSFGNATKAASGAASSLRSAFSGTLSALNATGVLGPFGDALAGIDSSIQRIGEHGKAIGPIMMGVGGAAAAAGVGLAALGSKDQAAHAQLQQAVEATGKSYDDYAAKIESAIKSQEKFGHTANQTQDALRILTQATNDPAKALQLLGTASDLAAAKHESLDAAATQMGKAYNGNAKILKEFGIQVQKTSTLQAASTKDVKAAQSADAALAKAKQHLADLETIDHAKKTLTIGDQIALRNAQQAVTDATAKAAAAHGTATAATDKLSSATKGGADAMTLLSQKLHGQASAAADTFTGKLDAVKAKVEDAAASFGQKYGPAITAAGSGMAILGGVTTATSGILKSFSTAQKGVEDASKGATAALEAQEVAEGLTLGPILLIVAAVAALVAIGYVIYRNWTTIWGGIKDIVKAVWDWIKQNWPLLLSILLGPIALAAALIWKYWKYIWDAIQVVWHWIVNNWPYLLVVLIGPMGLALGWVIKHWSTVVDFFKGILKDIGAVFTTAYHFIVDPIAQAFGWVEQAIGTVVGWFTDLPKNIGKAFSAVIGFLTAPFKCAFNAIATLWNDTIGKISFHIPSCVPGIGGKGFSMPKIPELAQGGLITQTGIVFAHAGEVISPTPNALRSVPAVNVEHAHFSTALDIESFMRRAAWVVQTQKI